MAKLTRARAEARAAALQAEYDAWQARAAEEGQDALALRRLIGRTRGLLRQVRRLDDPGGRLVAAKLSRQLTSYRDTWAAMMDAPGGVELGAFDDLTDALLRGEDAAAEQIAERLAAEEGGATTDEVELLGLRASFLLGRYARHFAGKPRASRDAHLLSDMERYLSKLVERLVFAVTMHADTPLMERIELLTEQLALWAEEQEEIAPARHALPPRPQLQALVELAGNLAAEWRVQVGAYPAASVRPRLVKRLITALELVRVELESLAATRLIDDPDARAAVAEVNARLAGWRDRREELAQERRGVTAASRARALQAEVAECILQWAREVTSGAHAPERVVRMGELCDRLHELERQLDRVARDQANDANVRLLAYARARLLEWELAYEQAAGD